MKRAILKTILAFLIYNYFLIVNNSSYSQVTKKDSTETKVDSVLKDSGMIKVVVHNNITKPIDTAVAKKLIVKEKNTNELPKIKDIFSVGKVVWALVILIISYLVIRFLTALIEGIAERSTRYRITLKSLSPVLRILGWTIAIYIVIRGIFNPPAAAIAAFVASASIAVGFAAQDILKNIFGGIMILFDRPFQMGDKIQVGDYYGEVVEIGLRSTRIVTKDDSLVSIPNAEVVNTAVSNSNSGEPNCQVVAEIYLPIDIDTAKARSIATQAAQISKYIYLNKPITVIFVNELKDRKSVLKMRLKAYVSDIRYEFVFQSEMTETVIRELIKSGLVEAD
jgi:small-conductance mechanosensitive channel